MGPAIFIMAILGCGEADAPCQQVMVTDAQYSSAEACTAATEGAIEEHQDIAFPVVVAECRPAGSRVAEQVMPEDIKLPEAQQPARIQRATYRPQLPLHS